MDFTFFSVVSKKQANKNKIQDSWQRAYVTDKAWNISRLTFYRKKYFQAQHLLSIQ